MNFKHFDFNKMPFSCFITNKNLKVSEFKNKFTHGEFNFYYSPLTELRYTNLNGMAVAILGYFVDSHGEFKKDEITTHICKNFKIIDDIISFSKRLCGRYNIFVFLNDDFYIIGDATSSMGLSYKVENGNFYASTHNYFLKEYANGKESETAKRIIKGSDNQKAMPNDLIIYEDTFFILPNHYFSLRLGGTKRFNLDISKKTIDECVDFTIDKIKNIVNEVSNDFDIFLPLTGGYDSRVVLAFLNEVNKDFRAYTLKHKMDPKVHSDLVVPKDICQKFNINYTQIDDEVISDEIINELDNILGKEGYSKYFASLGLTLSKNLKKGAFLNGDIIGQVGKASLHKTISPKWMNASYFSCKLHNHSKEAKNEMKKWINDAKSQKEIIGDLFSMEIRLGRWSSLSNLIYSSFGIYWLNIFNSYEIISSWINTPSEKRMTSDIHKGYLKRLDKELLNYGFNDSENKLIKFLRDYSLTYYISTFLKLKIQKLKSKF